jgi:metallo-beta-lactamase family protein
MKLTFYGAAQTVTGSQHMIEVNGTRILLDCGFYQGKRSESRERNMHLPFEASSVDVAILSHAHIDHSGNVPNLVKSGFRGDIISTHATRDLAAAMLQDSGHIQEKDAEYTNKKRARRNEEPIDPIYTQEDAKASLDQFVGIDYERAHEIAPGVVLTFYDAGHMLGSATVALDIQDHGTKRDVRLVFSGDIGHPGMPLLRRPTILDEADIVIMESTYGGRTHPPMESTEEKFEKTIDETFARGGKIIIPAFAVGRTQQIVYALNEMSNRHELPSTLPVFVDSPLAVNITDVFRLHPEAYSDEARDVLEADPDGDLFGFPRLKYVREVADSIKLNEMHAPAIIISASGMAEFGRILHHLKHNIADSRNTVLIVGWQAPDTLGRRLVEGAQEVKIFGEEYQRRAQVVVLNGFSGHADHPGLLNWVRGFENHRPQHIFLVHGEVPSAQALQASLRSDLGYQHVEIPALKQSYTV